MYITKFKLPERVDVHDGWRGPAGLTLNPIIVNPRRANHEP